MGVFVANEQDLPIDEPRLGALARHSLQHEGVEDEVELSVLFVSAGHMRRLNARFAGNDYATDVLAFPMAEDDDDDDEPTILGDVVVCPKVARDNARRAGQALEQELDALVVHGTLHLLGYDHQNKSDRARMDARTRQILASFDYQTA